MSKDGSRWTFSIANQGPNQDRVKNERYRSCLPEEELVLMSVLTGKREHLKGW